MNQIKQNNKKCTGSHWHSQLACTCDAKSAAPSSGEMEGKFRQRSASSCLGQALMPDVQQQGLQADHDFEQKQILFSDQNKQTRPPLPFGRFVQSQANFFSQGTAVTTNEIQLCKGQSVGDYAWTSSASRNEPDELKMGVHNLL